MPDFDLLATAHTQRMSPTERLNLQAKLGKRQLAFMEMGQRIELKHGDKITFGRVLTSLRKRHGWTQARIALELGVSSQRVSQWEKDNWMPQGTNVVGLFLLIPELHDVMRTIWPSCYDWVEHQGILAEESQGLGESEDET